MRSITRNPDGTFRPQREWQREVLEILVNDCDNCCVSDADYLEIIEDEGFAQWGEDHERVVEIWREWTVKHNGTACKIGVEWVTDDAGQPVWLDAFWDGTRWNGFPNVCVDRNVRDRIYGIGAWEGTLDADFWADSRNPDGTMDIPPLDEKGMAWLGGGACCVEMKEAS